MSAAWTKLACGVAGIPDHLWAPSIWTQSCWGIHKQGFKLWQCAINRHGKTSKKTGGKINAFTRTDLNQNKYCYLNLDIFLPIFIVHASSLCCFHLSTSFLLSILTKFWLTEKFAFSNNWPNPYIPCTITLGDSSLTVKASKRIRVFPKLHHPNQVSWKRFQSTATPFWMGPCVHIWIRTAIWNEQGVNCSGHSGSMPWELRAREV